MHEIHHVYRWKGIFLQTSSWYQRASKVIQKNVALWHFESARRAKHSDGKAAGTGSSKGSGPDHWFRLNQVLAPKIHRVNSPGYFVSRRRSTGENQASGREIESGWAKVFDDRAKRLPAGNECSDRLANGEDTASTSPPLSLQTLPLRVYM